MLARTLAFLSYYPNLATGAPDALWAALALLALWHTAVSWRVLHLSGLRSYAWSALGGALATAGTALLAAMPDALWMVLVPLPLLLAAFLITSVSDARAWFSDEAPDKYRLLRQGGWRLRVLGSLPPGFERRPGGQGATRRQGLSIAGSTLALMVFLYLGTRHMWDLGRVGAWLLLTVTLTSFMGGFHATMMGVFAAVYGTPSRPREARVSAPPTRHEKPS